MTGKPASVSAELFFLDPDRTRSRSRVGEWFAGSVHARAEAILQEAEVLIGEEGGPVARPATVRDGWDLVRFLSGIEAEDGAPAHVIGTALAGARPREFEDDLAWCRHLADDGAKLRELLAAPSLIDRLAEGLGRQMSALAEQAAATSKELNGKFVAESDAELSFGDRRLFDDGLGAWIGVPNQTAPMDEMWREHNEYAYACEEFCAGNYGVETDPIKEWIAAAGEWTPQQRSHAIRKDFRLPRETKNIEAEHMRRMICLDEFTRAPDETERQRWEVEADNDLERLPQQELARRRAHRAGLCAAEVLALRLWSGPMYYPYNSVLRSGTQSKYTTTLHVLVSAIIKLARIGTPEVVYRGLSGRSIVLEDFDRGFFVEKGAQSFTRDKSVAQKYASWGRKGAASYLIEVQEGWADQGADISAFSYYPYEKEKLYGPLVLMQLMDSSIERSTLKLKMRLNINLHDGTLDEAVSARKRFIMSRQMFMLHACRTGWDSIKSALELDRVEHSRQASTTLVSINSSLKLDTGMRLEDAEEKFEKRRAQEETLFASIFEQLERQEAEWFNDDANYKAALNECIDFHKNSISRIVMSVLEDKRQQADIAEKSICQPKVKNVCCILQECYAQMHGDVAAAEAGAGSRDDNVDDMITIECEPCDSSYPLYETEQAGLEHVAECMKSLKVGFREYDVAEAGRLVMAERRERIWDSVDLGLTLSLVCVVSVIGFMWLFNRSGPDDAWWLLALFWLRCIPEVLNPSLQIWILTIPPPLDFVPYAIWRFRKYLALLSFPCLYLGFQSLRMWERAKQASVDYYDFRFEYDWLEVPLWFGSWIPFFDYPLHLAVRQLCLSELARRNAPDLLSCYPALFAVVYPGLFYLVWMGLFTCLQFENEKCYWPTGRLDHLERDPSLGIVVCIWYAVVFAVAAVYAWRRHTLRRREQEQELLE